MLVPVAAKSPRSTVGSSKGATARMRWANMPQGRSTATAVATKSPRSTPGSSTAATATIRSTHRRRVFNGGNGDDHVNEIHGDTFNGGAGDDTVTFFTGGTLNQ
jgi:hypothetical protein